MDLLDRYDIPAVSHVAHRQQFTTRSAPIEKTPLKNKKRKEFCNNRRSQREKSHRGNNTQVDAAAKVGRAHFTALGAEGEVARCNAGAHRDRFHLSHMQLLGICHGAC